MYEYERLLALKSIYADDDSSSIISAYTIQERIGGNAFIFSDDFILKLRYALSTDCSGDFDGYEDVLLNDFIAYQNGGLPTTESIKLDQWVSNLVKCSSNPSLDQCPIDYTHTFIPCK